MLSFYDFDVLNINYFKNIGHTLKIYIYSVPYNARSLRHFCVVLNQMFFLIVLLTVIFAVKD